MREPLGDKYVESLRSAYPDVPSSSDFVMYWWHSAAGKVGSGLARRFGFITTNSITQAFNRRVIQFHVSSSNPINLSFAIPDHPWVDSTDGAAVRIAMTVGDTSKTTGNLLKVESEKVIGDDDAAEVIFLEKVE